MQIVNYVLAGLAIVVMAFNTVLTFRLRRKLIGGEVGARWNVLSILVMVFLVAFILSPLLLVLNAPVDFLLLAVFSVFFLGAVFVGLVVRVVGDILQVMDLLED
jgi:drug/metabolite transporter (DMT)-like permease